MRKPPIYRIAGRDYVQGRDINLSKEKLFNSKGQRITEELLDEVVQESFVRGIGRPSLTAPTVHSPEIKARVPAPLKEKLEKVAQARGETPSALIRQAVEEFLRKTS